MYLSSIIFQVTPPYSYLHRGASIAAIEQIDIRWRVVSIKSLPYLLNNFHDCSDYNKTRLNYNSFLK